MDDKGQNMETNRDAARRNRDTSYERAERRDLLTGFGLAAAIAAVGLSVLFLARRSIRPTDAPLPVTQSSNPAEKRLAATTPADSSRFDPRLSATKRIGGDDEQPQQSGAPGGDDAEPASEPSAPAPTPAADVADPQAKPDNPRQLLKKMRGQVAEGDSAAALETSRQIVSRLDDAEDRSGLRRRTGEAAAAHAAGQQIDFDSLMDLIRNTIATDTWDSAGGTGSMRPFPGGVYVDVNGLVRPRSQDDTTDELTRVRDAARARAGQGDPAAPRSDLRFVSLPELEREVAHRIDANQPLPDDVRFLAGLTQIQYLLVYPDEHDVVVAGPAEPWRRDELGRVVGADSGRPVLELDDLVVILRACFSESERPGIFGCGIYPREERLAAVQKFLASSAGRPIDPMRRDHWLAELRDQLGEQDIEVFGVPAGSRVAHVLVEADYRMKLIGIGLERAAVKGIPSYFELLGEPTTERLSRGLDTLRWWFTMNYDAVVATASGDTFELRGGRVKVLSENELLTATGQVVPTGQSDAVNGRFARNFTERFSSLAGRDANFADLAGVFDLAVLAGLLSAEHAPERAGWAMTTFLDPDEYIVPLRPTPRTVESVINHRVYHGRHIIAVVSGGVMADPWKVIGRELRQSDSGDRLTQTRNSAVSSRGTQRRWWWD